MQLSDLLSPACTSADEALENKKQVLERLSQLISQVNDSIEQQTLFSAFVNRERLGSTAIGRGVAIPHVRCEQLDQPIGAFLQLQAGVDFQGPDETPVDLVFALVVGQEATEEHLQILAQLAKLFSDTQLRDKLRQSADNTTLYNTLMAYNGTITTS